MEMTISLSTYLLTSPWNRGEKQGPYLDLTRKLGRLLQSRIDQAHQNKGIEEENMIESLSESQKSLL